VFRGIRSCLTLIGLAVVVLVGYMAYTTLGRARQPLVTPAPAAVQPAAGAGGVDARLASAEADIRQNAARGVRKTYTFSLSDAEMTASIKQALTSGEVQAPVSGVAVASVPGHLNITGQARAAVVSVPFTMTAVPRVDAGKAQLEVTAVDFGGLAVPAVLRDQLTGAVNRDNLLGDVPLRVTSFRAEQGQAVLEGTT
jgi:hypothetical protein